MDDKSVGLVEGHIKHFSSPFKFQAGGQIESLDLAYETYGKLNQQRSNAVLVCHALSGHQHAAGKSKDNPDNIGWWDVMIGPGKPIDTNKYFVLSTNNIGGCHGTTGPKSINPATNKAYGRDFPQVNVEDWVEAQRLLAVELGIAQFTAVVGGSIGAMQTLSWSIRHPKMIRLAVIIAGTPQLTTQNIAFNEIARQSIMRDPHFNNGDFYGSEAPKAGLAVARMLGHVTYLSDEDMQNKFGRERKAESGTFEIESYLRYNADKFAETFDANTYVLMTKALDAFDPASNGDLAKALEPALAKFLVVCFKKDWRFPAERSRELVAALFAANKYVSYAELSAPGGHDAFLQGDPTYHEVVKGFLDKQSNLAHD